MFNHGRAQLVLILSLETWVVSEKYYTELYHSESEDQDHSIIVTQTNRSL